MRDILAVRDNFRIYQDVESELYYGNYDSCPSPKVSIVMPVYNHPDYFRRSLQSSLNQDYGDSFEIVVVDNDDSDVTETLNFKVVSELNAPNVFYYRNQKNIGLFGNWNRCIQLARAPFLVYCHDDDILLPNALSRLMILQKKSGNKAIFSAFNKIDAEDKYIRRHRTDKKLLGVLKKRTSFTYSLFEQFMNEVGNGVGALYTKECLLEIGGFDPEFYPVADYALYVNYTYRFGSIYNTQPTYNYRMADNESYTCYNEILEVDKHIWQSMKKAIHLPDILLNRIITAKYNTKKIGLSIDLGKQNKSLKKTLRFSDKLILKFIHIIFFFKRYGI